MNFKTLLAIAHPGKNPNRLIYRTALIDDKFFSPSDPTKSQGTEKSILRE